MTTSATEATTQPDIVTLSDTALDKMKGILADQPDMGGIRLGVNGGGCAGLQYDMQPEAEPNGSDIVQTMNGVDIYIHPMVVPYLKGIHLDYSNALVDGGFKFTNPNATSTCGCGTSFGV